LEVYPEYLPAVMGTAQLTVRGGREDERLLETIAMRAEDACWQEWSREQALWLAGRR